VSDHLSRMNRGQDDKEPIEDKMRDDHLYRVLDKDTWMIDIIRAIRKMPLDHLDKNSQKKIISESRKYFRGAPYLFKLGNDGVMRRCVPREERVEILRKCHSAEYGGHYSHFRAMRLGPRTSRGPNFSCEAETLSCEADTSRGVDLSWGFL
jgi:hypothetical protein